MTTMPASTTPAEAPRPTGEDGELTVSVVIPCLNEEENIAA